MLQGSLVPIALAFALPHPSTADENTELESLTNLVQNITSFLPSFLAQGQENNRVLRTVCGLLEEKCEGHACSMASNAMVPSVLGMGVAMAVVLVGNMVRHSA